MKKNLPHDLFRSKLAAPDLADILYEVLENKGFSRGSTEWENVQHLQKRGRAALVREIERVAYGMK